MKNGYKVIKKKIFLKNKDLRIARGEIEKRGKEGKEKRKMEVTCACILVRMSSTGDMLTTEKLRAMHPESTGGSVVLVHGGYSLFYFYFLISSLTIEVNVIWT